MNTLTVDGALKELREMFPGKWIAFDFSENHTIGPRGKHTMEGVALVQIESTNGDLNYQSEAKSISKLMQKIRKWKESQQS